MLQSIGKTLQVARAYKTEVIEEWKTRKQKREQARLDEMAEHTIQKIALRCKDDIMFWISGEFGYPSKADVKELVFNCFENNYLGVRNYVLKFADYHKNISEDPEVAEHIKKKGFRKPLDIGSHLDGKTGLAVACMRGNDRIAELLLREGASSRRKDVFGKTALHYACISGSYECADLVVNHSANVDARDHDGITALMDACKHGYDDMVDLLLECGADINLKDKLHRWTALHYAASKGYIEVMKLLLLSGADYEAISRDKKSPCDIALDKENKEAAICLQKWKKKKRLEAKGVYRYVG